MRIVVLRALGLGDLLTAVPAMRGLRTAFPAAHLVLAGPVALAPLARAAGVEEVADTHPLAPLDSSLHGAQLALNLHGRGPQSTALLAATQPDRLISYGVTSTWQADEHEVARWCRLLTEADIPADPAALALAPPALASPAPGAVLVHAGAAQASRLWPVERWAAVAGAVRAQGHRVVLTGSAAERGRALSVAAAAGIDPADVRAGRTTLDELATLVHGARLLLSVDTGVAHLATAYGTPSVVLFGPTPPSLWGPPPDRPQHHALWAGRTGDNFGADIDPGLLALSTDEVVEAAMMALAHHRPCATHRR